MGLSKMQSNLKCSLMEIAWVEDADWQSPECLEQCSAFVGCKQSAVDLCAEYRRTLKMQTWRRYKLCFVLHPTSPKRTHLEAVIFQEYQLQSNVAIYANLQGS